MARIDRFILGPDLVNLNGLEEDLLGKILDEHTGGDNAVTHRELCHYYFDPRPIALEGEILITNILQKVRGVLQEGGWFLHFQRGNGWFAVVTSDEAYRHLRSYARRQVRLHRRLQTKVAIGTGERYQLPASDHLIQAIQGITPRIEELEEAIEEEPPQLPEGEE